MPKAGADTSAVATSVLNVHPSLPFRLIAPSFLSLQAVSTALGQLPLTTLNSIIAAAALSSDLLAAQLATFSARTPSAAAIGASVAVMNLVGCWFGAMPVCHGAGGLAAQFRFGARSGASVMLLGAAKLALGLACALAGGRGDSWLLALLGRFPDAILGVMVLAAGLELARVGQSLNHGASDLWEACTEQEPGGPPAKRHRHVTDEERERRWNVMLVTAAGILALKNDAVGFMAGLLCHAIYRLADRLESDRYRHLGLGRGEHSPLLR